MKFKILFFLLFLSLSGFAERIRVQGKVCDQNSQPLAGVYIYVGNGTSPMASTDDDGVFSFFATENSILRFESIGCAPQEVVVKGLKTIEVVMISETIQLDEVRVVAKVRKIIPEPTDIEIKGNYFHLRTRIKVPKELFKSDMRLVVQTSIYNVTDRERILLRPLVLDGEEYTIAQKRMYDFNLSKDPLIPFVYRHSSEQPKSDIIPYYDSTYVADPRGDYRADVLMILEGYNRVVYRDSFAIARGLVNPLRFFQYDLKSSDLTGEEYIPKAALQLCNDRGSIELIYATGSSKLDLKDSQNRTEVEKLQQRLLDIENDPEAQLKSFSINGTASPEGNYASNKVLARQRMKNAGDLIMKALSSSSRERIDFATDARVEEWMRVVELMRADGLSEQANELESIVDKYPGKQDLQFRLIRRLPYYRTVIVKDYLSSLRRVEYAFDYSLFRVLNDDEIRALYAKDPKKLSRYEYYRLFECEKDTTQLRKLYNESLILYPRFVLAANRLAVLNLMGNCPDEKVLAPFITEDAPVEVVMNQTYTFLKKRMYGRADSVAFYYMADNEKTAEMKAVVATINGDYETYYDRICSQGGLNEVLLLLARKENKKAWEKAKALSQDVAVHNYVRAVAANRLDMIPEALSYMRMAFSQDESLREVAAVDGDVVDLMEIL